MKNNLEIINAVKQLPLFNNIEDNDIPDILTFFKANTKEHQKGAIIKQLWEPVKEAGLVLKGSVIIKFLSDSGNEHRITKVAQGSVFALSFACSKSASGDTVEIVADENCKVLYLELSNLFYNKKESSKALEQVSINLLGELAEKNTFLNKKVEILAHHKIRDRVLVFLMSMSKGKKHFKIPLNREAMASFLGVERSSLSRELSKMKSEGLIDYEGSDFSLFIEDYL